MDGWDGWINGFISGRGRKKKGSVGQQAGRNKGRDEGYIYIYIYMYMIYDTNRMLEMEMPLFFSKIKKIRWGRGRLLGQSVARVYFDSMAWHAYIHNIT